MKCIYYSFFCWIMTTSVLHSASAKTYVGESAERFKVPRRNGNMNNVPIQTQHPSPTPPPKERHSWWDLVDGVVNRLERRKLSASEQKRAHWELAKKFVETRAKEEARAAKLAADIEKLKAKIDQREKAKALKKQENQRQREKEWIARNKIPQKGSRIYGNNNESYAPRRRRTKMDNAQKFRRRTELSSYDQEEVQQEQQQQKRSINHHPINTNRIRDRRLVQRNYV